MKTEFDSPGPKWVRELVGHRAFEPIFSMTLSGNDFAKCIDELEAFPGLFLIRVHLVPPERTSGLFQVFDRRMTSSNRRITESKTHAADKRNDKT